MVDEGILTRTVEGFGEGPTKKLAVKLDGGVEVSCGEIMKKDPAGGAVIGGILRNRREGGCSCASGEEEEESGQEKEAVRHRLKLLSLVRLWKAKRMGMEREGNSWNRGLSSEWCSLPFRK